MAELRQNTWTLDQWYDQDVAGNVSYTAPNLLYSWGDNGCGNLGQNNTTKYSSPVQIPGTNWNYLSADGSSASMATKLDGTLWSWGCGGYGNLGHNNTTEYSSPKQIPGTTWEKVAITDYNGYSIRTDGTLWGMGANTYGALGQGNWSTPRSSPIQVIAESAPHDTWRTISISYQNAIGTKTDGTLWTWGRNDNGEMGHNSREDLNRPQRVGTDETWSTITVLGQQQAMSIKTDGTLWTWGTNGNGELGHNNTTKYSSPVQLGSDTTWSDVSGGKWHSHGIKTDGTLWSWGYNAQGQLGQNNRTEYSSPTQIPGTNWKHVEAGASVIATKTDGTLWAWGYNEGGQLGQNQGPGNQTGSYSSPVQIPGTDWSLEKKTMNRNSKYFLLKAIQ